MPQKKTGRWALGITGSRWREVDVGVLALLLSGRGGRPHPLEGKFLRMLVVVDMPVLDEDRDDGGYSGGGNGSGGNSGNGNGTNFILSPLIGNVIKKTSQASTRSGSPQGGHMPSSRGRRITGSCHGVDRASWGTNL
jgi:hypothetical protein